MDQFLAASFAYPTIVFTVLLGVAIGYWLLSLVGAVGLDTLDFDADFDADVNPEVDPFAAAGLFQRQPIRVIPLTIALSLFFFFGWFICHVVCLYAGASLNQLLPQWLWGTVLLLTASFLSLLIANLIASPMAPVFMTHKAPRKSDLLGRVVQIRTGRVDENFGTAEAENGGAGLIVEVRCKAGRLTRGDRALVIEYDSDGEFYHVEPLDEAMRG